MAGHGADTGFRPSIHGFRFSNYFAAGPVMTLHMPGFDVPIGDASRGLCGGMVFAARDYFDAGHDLPPDEDPPLPGTPLFRYLFGRLLDSFHLPTGPLKYYLWQNLPEEDAWYARGLVRRTCRDEWPRIRAEIDRGRPAPIGFIRDRTANPFRLGENHQVMSYAYRTDGCEVTLRIYDPNRAMADDLTMTFRPDEPFRRGAIEHSCGESVRGFFFTPYRRSRARSLQQNGVRPLQSQGVRPHLVAGSKPPAPTT